eukprot:6175609-Pleurochrysis_carterae.AAC.1
MLQASVCCSSAGHTRTSASRSRVLHYDRRWTVDVVHGLSHRAGGRLGLGLVYAGDRAQRRHLAPRLGGRSSGGLYDVLFLLEEGGRVAANCRVLRLCRGGAHGDGKQRVANLAVRHWRQVDGNALEEAARDKVLGRRLEKPDNKHT